MMVTPGLNASATAGADLPASGLMVEPFPEPSRDIQRAFESLSEYQANPPQTPMGVQDLAATPRPWEPATLTGRLRLQMWLWLDDIAEWINTQHLWSTVRPGIPECWSAHPHLVHDLAVLASVRYLAGFAASPGAMEDWHQYSLPMFLDRLRDRLADGCQPGKHQARPRAERDRHYLADPASADRRKRFDADVRCASG